MKIITEKNKYIHFAFIAFCAAIFILNAVLTYKTPFTGDCYYASVHGMYHQWSFHAIFKQCITNYLYNNGRIGDTIMNFLCSSSQKNLFCALNPFFMICLPYSIFYMVTGRHINTYSIRDCSLFSFAAILILFSTPVPGVTIYWLPGATSYFWSATIWVSFLCLYRGLFCSTSKIADSPWNRFWIILFGFTAGMTNENSAPATIGLLTIFFVYSFYHKIKLPKWSYYGFASALLGCICLIFAPGNAVRLKTSYENSEILSTWSERFAAIPKLIKLLDRDIKLTLYILAASIIIAFILFIRKKLFADKSARQQFIFSILFLLTAYSMAICFFIKIIPPDRTMFSASIMLIIASLSFLKIGYDNLKNIHPIIIINIVYLIIFLHCSTLYLEVYNKMDYYFQQRIALIHQKIDFCDLQHTEISIVVPRFPYIHTYGFVSTPWIPEIFDPEHPRNKSIAKYYNLKSYCVSEKYN